MKNWIKVDELVESENYIINNYSLKTRVKYLGMFQILDYENWLYIFEIIDKEDYKAYSKEQLERENIKIEKIEEEI